MKNKIRIEKNKLNSHIRSLNKQQKNMKHLDDNYYTVEGEQESSGLKATSNWYHYIVWIILAFTVVSITLHSLTSKNTSTMGNGLALIFCIIILFLLVRWFYSKLK